MSVHRIYLDQAQMPLEVCESGVEIAVTGEEAKHAIRVKRLRVRDAVELLDGHGRVAEGRVAGSGKRGDQWQLMVAVNRVRMAPAERPRVEVYSAVPKGPRVAELIDQLSQVGAAMWSPAWTGRGVAGAGDAKLARLERIAAEACKQAGRAWRLEIGTGVRAADVIGAESAHGRATVQTATPASAEDGTGRGGGSPSVATVIAQAGAEPYQACGARTVRLFVGPEGGWTVAELDQAQQRGAVLAGFGPHVMRIETAATAAAAIVLHAERAARTGMG